MQSFDQCPFCPHLKHALPVVVRCCSGPLACCEPGARWDRKFIAPEQRSFA